MSYVERIERRTRGILACLALSGNSRIHRDVIALILRAALLDLHDTLNTFASDGMIAKLPNDLDHVRFFPGT